ncbi:Tna1p [Sugiyamaella lignohabitans]|uniref:Tna1p n=1 Tax=Sugiyamaella lignohabitans TaxID=796027 RepID=A0A167CP40_9ASCO|nr:Tna1p [Sugiyamaella lignohabitans]ANB11942.1 Tna1p [Sugiyamaella lignohabitans]
MVKQETSVVDIEQPQELELATTNVSHEKKGISVEVQEALDYEYTPEEEKRVVRKFDMNILIYLFFLYMLSFLDRGNIGNANTAGMSKDLNMSDSQYQWLLTIFYIFYICFEFMILCYKIFPPRLYVPTIVIGWGITSTCCAAAQKWEHLMGLRALLGIFEASFGPGAILYISFFYYRHEVAAKNAIFLSSAPLATTFSGALAYGITKHNLAIASWRVLFLVEGLPTIVVGAIGYYAIPNGPTTCRFLTEHEKRIAGARMAKQTGRVNMEKTLHFKEMLRAAIDIKVWIPMIMYFSINVPFSSLPVFTPAIIEGMGFTSVNSQGLSALPYIYTFLTMLGAAYLSDRIKRRGIVIAFLALHGAAGYLILALSTTVGARYFALFLAAGGIFPCIALVLSWQSNNQGTESQRATGFVLLQTLGQSGPLVGTRLFPSTDAPLYHKGFWVSFGFCCLLFACACTLMTHLYFENKKLDARYGPIEESDEVEVTSDAYNAEGEFNPRFRYIM